MDVYNQPPIPIVSLENPNPPEKKYIHDSHSNMYGKRLYGIDFHKRRIFMVNLNLELCMNEVPTKAKNLSKLDTIMVTNSLS